MADEKQVANAREATPESVSEWAYALVRCQGHPPLEGPDPRIMLEPIAAGLRLVKTIMDNIEDGPLQGLEIEDLMQLAKVYYDEESRTIRLAQGHH